MKINNYSFLQVYHLDERLISLEQLLAQKQMRYRILHLQDYRCPDTFNKIISLVAQKYLLREDIEIEYKFVYDR